MSFRVLPLTCLAAAALAVDIPAIDLVGGAAFNEGKVGIGLYSTDATARSADRDFATTSLVATVSSVSSYPLKSNPTIGGLLGAEVKLQGWTGNNHHVDYSAADASIALVGGGYWKVNKSFRLGLTASAGPGLTWSSLDTGEEAQSDFGPSGHAGVVLEAVARSSKRSEIGVNFGYAYDYLPAVTSQGPFIALVMTFIAGGGKD